MDLINNNPLMEEFFLPINLLELINLYNLRSEMKRLIKELEVN